MRYIIAQKIATQKYLTSRIDQQLKPHPRCHFCFPEWIFPKAVLCSHYRDPTSLFFISYGTNDQKKANKRT